jgi:hypothetical protein
MSDCLLGVRPTKDQESDIRIRDDVLNDPLDAKVLSVQSTDDGETIRLLACKVSSKNLAVQCADCHGSTVTQDMEVSR